MSCGDLCCLWKYGESHKNGKYNYLKKVQQLLFFAHMCIPSWYSTLKAKDSIQQLLGETYLAV